MNGTANQPLIEVRGLCKNFGDLSVLKGIDHNIYKGEKVAVIGPSGSGKSTLTRLLMRTYDACSGDIRIDGKSIKSYTRAELSAKFGVAMQNDFLFADTVRENIDFARGLTDEDISRAARIAQAAPFIEAYEEGYDYQLDAKGANISGGQKQRLCIARALLKSPKILILDEATSSVDTRTEMHIQQAMVALMKNRTSLIIAHRLSTIHNADRIIVIDAGRIAEQGTHSELIAKGGIYAKLIEMQSLA